MSAHPGKRFTASLAVLSLIVIAAFAVASWALFVSHDRASTQRDQLCQAQNRTREAVASVLELAQTASLANPHLTAGDRRRIDSFYAEAQSKLRPIGC